MTRSTPSRYDAEHQRPQHVVGHPGAGVAQDLGVAGLQPEHPQRVDPGVHAGQHGQPAGGGASQRGQREAVGEPLVGRQHVGEGVVGRHAPETTGHSHQQVQVGTASAGPPVGVVRDQPVALRAAGEPAAAAVARP